MKKLLNLGRSAFTIIENVIVFSGGVVAGAAFGALTGGITAVLIANRGDEMIAALSPVKKP